MCRLAKVSKHEHLPFTKSGQVRLCVSLGRNQKRVAGVLAQLMFLGKRYYAPAAPLELYLNKPRHISAIAREKKHWGIL